MKSLNFMGLDFSQSKNLLIFLGIQIVSVGVVYFFVTGSKLDSIAQITQENRNLNAQIQSLISEEKIYSEETVMALGEKESHLKSELASIIRSLTYQPPAEFVLPPEESPRKFFLNILNECTKALKRKIPIQSDLLGFSSEVPSDQEVATLLILLAMGSEVVEQAVLSRIRSIEKMRPVYEPQQDKEESDSFLTPLNYQFEVSGEIRSISEFLHRLQGPKQYYFFKDAELLEDKTKKGLLRLKLTISKFQIRPEVPLKLDPLPSEQPHSVIRRY